MANELDARLHEFHADLDRAERLLDLLDQFRRFGGSYSARKADENATESWVEAESLGEVAQTVRTDLPLLSGALHMYVCGRFEFFVRDVVVAVADMLCASVTTYTDLPEKLRSELKHLTLAVAQNPARYGYKPEAAEAILVSLASNLSTETPISVPSEVLAITESNMNPETLAEIMKRVGIDKVWQELGKQAKLRSHLSVRAEGECTQEARTRLASIMRDRNNFAHPTSSAEFPDVAQVKATCSFLRALSEVLVDVAKLPQC